MRARADAGIFVIAPVDEIVPALGARPRVIGDLVGRQAARRRDLLRHVVERARAIVVRDDELAGRVQRGERRVLLDGELIEREMLGGFGDRALELGAPRLRRLARPRVDEIERIALERRARDLHRIERFLRGVQPAEFLQRRIVERLHAERHAIDAGRAIAAKARRLDAGRIGLERDLDVGRDRPVLADRVEDRADGRRAASATACRRPRRWSRRCARRYALGGRGDLGREGAHVALLVDAGVAHMAVEVAIRALRQAERPVHVDAEASVARSLRRSASLKTRLRELEEGARAVRQALALAAAGRASASRVISPKVRSKPSGRNIGS